MSIDEVARELNRTLDGIPEATLIAAIASIDAAIEQLAPLAVGSDELAAVCRQWQQISVALLAIRHQCHAAGQLIEQYMDAIGAVRQTQASPPAVPRPTAASPPPPEPLPTIGVDGSQYPAAAKWAVDEGLPPRVRRGEGTPTTGYIQINGVPMRVQSGDDPFSDMVDERLRALGVRQSLALRRHVEMKMAALLLRSRQRHLEVVVNHAPCGSEPGQSRGCHAMLAPFLTDGRSMTVHGTTADGRPFSRTYYGEGS